MTFYNRKIPVILVTLGLALFWIFSEIVSSDKTSIVDDVPELIFSHESGFYDEEFDLKITSARGEIYYTLDGSIPTCDSIHYVSPIHIYDATVNPNVYASRTDVSTGFYTDLIDKYSYGVPGYEVPKYSVDKCMIVRAVICYGKESYSRVKTASYFVGYGNKPGYAGMNFISIVSDPENLFDYDNGIYVTGRAFDEYIVSDWDERRGMWWWWISNYSYRGIESEREANMQFFDPNGKLRLSQACGIRIRGGGSRGRNPKGLNLYARTIYDGNGHFYTDLWGDGQYVSKFSLSQGGDDEIFKAKDYIVNELCRDMNFATMQFKPCVLFLDGEYWGGILDQ